MRNDVSEAVWNMDDEILKVIKNLKISFLNSMKVWSLDDAYFFLTLIWMEIDAKLKDTEQEELEKEIKELEVNRITFLKEKREKGMFFVKLRQVYINMNRKMKSHGLYFRERDDYGL